MSSLTSATRRSSGAFARRSPSSPAASRFTRGAFSARTAFPIRRKPRLRIRKLRCNSGRRFARNLPPGQSYWRLVTHRGLGDGYIRLASPSAIPLVRKDLARRSGRRLHRGAKEYGRCGPPRLEEPAAVELRKPLADL